MSFRQVFIAVLILSLCSCSIQKRTFNKGYFVQWNLKSKIKSTLKNLPEEVCFTDKRVFPDTLHEGSTSASKTFSAELSLSDNIELPTDSKTFKVRDKIKFSSKVLSLKSLKGLSPKKFGLENKTTPKKVRHENNNKLKFFFFLVVACLLLVSGMSLFTLALLSADALLVLEHVILATLLTIFALIALSVALIYLKKSKLKQGENLQKRDFLPLLFFILSIIAYILVFVAGAFFYSLFFLFLSILILLTAIGIFLFIKSFIE